MFTKLLIIIGLASAGLLLVLLNVTTPGTAGALGIMAVFLLGYSITTVLLTFALLLLEKVVRKVSNEIRPARGRTVLSVRKAYYYASVIALAPVIFVSMQSVGGVGIYEILLVALLVVLGCLYISRRTR